MSKANGKILRFNGENGEEENITAVTSRKLSPIAKIGLAAIPFTPVPLTGIDGIYGWGRIALYGTLTYFTFEKNRKLSYMFGAATALSLVTSLAGKAWNDGTAEKTQEKP